ncbi:MAG: hypothetical protein QOF33_3659 [Thermomicrobiales bacterium]|nr:hypothetical protein [Thermomicrobiales bacterium]
MIQYFYTFSTPEEREVLSFHWMPHARVNNAVTFPHLHIGPAITAGQTAIRPRDLHKAHIPTGYVSLPAVVRRAITELGVVPLRPDWHETLTRLGAIFSDGSSGDMAGLPSRSCT